MPKMKPHSGMGKRVRVTGGGKVMSEQCGVRHKLEHKSSTRKRRQSGVVVLDKVEKKRISRLLGL
jgi:large subunit ribosomal protein L35